MPASASTYRFGPFRLDAGAYRLHREETLLSLSPKLVDLLLYLVRHPGSLVTKEELFAALWPDVTVTDNALAQAISDLRHALGDNPSSPQYIQTVARRGYRFIGQVRADEAVSAEGATAAPASHETSNLEAYRAFTEGRLKLESLEVATVRDAVADFERAVTHDPRYALAFTGLAAAHFLLSEASRMRHAPDAGVLATAIAYARRAVDLDPQLAEAHAMLAFMLVSADHPAEAVAHGRRAAALAPGDWRHQFRLGHAAWGEERLRALERALQLYPDLAFAHFEMAMVRIARSELPRAEVVLREGALVLDRHRDRSWRFPASGLHWLLGMVLLSRGALDEAQQQFDVEVAASDPGRIYGVEFVTNAHDGRAFTLLERGELARALDAFDRALERYPGHARARLGRARALREMGEREQVEREISAAREAIDELGRGGRQVEVRLMTAADQAFDGRHAEAIATLTRMLGESPPGFAGWMIPVDPLFFTLRQVEGFAEVRSRLADRAR